VEGEGERGVAIESEIRMGSCAYRKRARDKPKYCCRLDKQVQDACEDREQYENGIFLHRIIDT